MDFDAKNLDLKKASILVLGLALLMGFVFFQNDIESTESGDFNRNDVMFMNMMVLHHDQAIEMAEMSAGRTSNENILELSNNISEAQTRENEQMSNWLEELGYQRPVRGHRMAGMASTAEMRQLRNSNGSEYNKLFAELMIRHHEGGIAMAQNFYNSGENSELREMQGEMIEAQQEEIRKMQEWQEAEEL